MLYSESHYPLSDSTNAFFAGPSTYSTVVYRQPGLSQGRSVGSSRGMAVATTSEVEGRARRMRKGDERQRRGYTPYSDPYTPGSVQSGATSLSSREGSRHFRDGGLNKRRLAHLQRTAREREERERGYTPSHAHSAFMSSQPGTPWTPMSINSLGKGQMDITTLASAIDPGWRGNDGLKEGTVARVLRAMLESNPQRRPPAWKVLQFLRRAQDTLSGKK